VRQQYEENPYPRWIRPGPANNAHPVREFVRRHVSPARSADDILEVLIAGCGTGQEAVEFARFFPDARILAVDLSVSSLSYAMRKTRELNVQNIDYAQADILNLSTCGRRFDVIVSSGVLHHLEHPEEGLQQLTSILRPSGLIRLGLYSRAAREGVSTAQSFR